MIITILLNMVVNLGILCFGSCRDLIIDLKKKYRVFKFKRVMEARKKRELKRQEAYTGNLG